MWRETLIALSSLDHTLWTSNYRAGQALRHTLRLHDATIRKFSRVFQDHIDPYMG